MEVGTKFLEGGLHDRPNLLREKLQQAIDVISADGRCERIIVGYGVCGRGTIGVRSRGVPLSIPKVHDCIALFLGGDAAYKREFKRFPGTYYISAGWYEEKTEPHSQRQRTAYYGDEKLNYDELVEKYGKAAADETFQFLNTWQKNYQRAAFIETGARKSSKYEKYASQMAEQYGWAFEKIIGNQSLTEKLLTAAETTDEVLVVPPDHVIEFDALQSTLSANPIWSAKSSRSDLTDITVIDGDGADVDPSAYMKIGLGIDAGGTYTDTVIYDIHQSRTLSKRKALTTKWDFTVGISEALFKLDEEKLGQVEMVSLSTTLATNA
ncbi:MAG: DUF1638 domain-containing protein, partial [Deltaproteobacteria bacterium]|nr:DUF1638 domain-containing protein [Deltaproteobacteria bacterium]